MICSVFDHAWWLSIILQLVINSHYVNSCYDISYIAINYYEFQSADFNLRWGCSFTDIIQKCKKWFQIAVHGLKIRPILAKIGCTSFLIRKNVETWQYGRTKVQPCCFSWNKSLRSYTPHTKVVKKQCFRYNLLKLN